MDVAYTRTIRESNRDKKYYEKSLEQQSHFSETVTRGHRLTSAKMTDFLEVLPPLRADDRNETLAIVEIVILVIIFLLAVIGNSFVLSALIEQKKCRPWSRIYFLMAHLSIADLLVALFNILPQIVWDITFRFKGGDPLCRFVKYMQVFVLYLSTYVLVAMSLDRYFAVVGPRSSWKSSPALTKVLVMLAWTIALIFSLPQAFIFSYQLVKPDVFDCWATFPNFFNQKLYVTWFVLSAFGIPLLIICTCYGTICFKIWSYNYDKLRISQRKKDRGVKYQNTILTTSANNESILPSVVIGSESMRVESDGNISTEDCPVLILISTAKMKTIKLTTIIIVCFIVCWTPFCFTQLYLTYFPPTSESEIGPIPTIFLLLASLNSCCNPWIYLVFSESLMNHLKRLLIKIGFPCFHCCCDHDRADNVIPRSSRTAHRVDERTRKQQDSIGGTDDERDDANFIAMDQLNKELRASDTQTENRIINNLERSKQNVIKEGDGRAHRPSDPLLTTSTKFTGI